MKVTEKVALFRKNIPAMDDHFQEIPLQLGKKAPIASFEKSRRDFDCTQTRISKAFNAKPYTRGFIPKPNALVLDFDKDNKAGLESSPIKLVNDNFVALALTHCALMELPGMDYDLASIRLNHMAENVPGPFVTSLSPSARFSSGHLYISAPTEDAEAICATIASVKLRKTLLPHLIESLGPNAETVYQLSKRAVTSRLYWEQSARCNTIGSVPGTSELSANLDDWQIPATLDEFQVVFNAYIESITEYTVSNGGRWPQDYIGIETRGPASGNTYVVGVGSYSDSHVYHDKWLDQRTIDIIEEKTGYAPPEWSEGDTPRHVYEPTSFAGWLDQQFGSIMLPLPAKILEAISKSHRPSRATGGKKGRPKSKSPQKRVKRSVRGFKSHTRDITSQWVEEGMAVSQMDHMGSMHEYLWQVQKELDKPGVFDGATSIGGKDLRLGEMDKTILVSIFSAFFATVHGLDFARKVPYHVLRMDLMNFLFAPDFRLMVEIFKLMGIDRDSYDEAQLTSAELRDDYERMIRKGYTGCAFAGGAKLIDKLPYRLALMLGESTLSSIENAYSQYAGSKKRALKGLDQDSWREATKSSLFLSVSTVKNHLFEGIGINANRGLRSKHDRSGVRGESSPYGVRLETLNRQGGDKAGLLASVTGSYVPDVKYATSLVQNAEESETVISTALFMVYHAYGLVQQNHSVRGIMLSDKFFATKLEVSKAILKSARRLLVKLGILTITGKQGQGTTTTYEFSESVRSDELTRYLHSYQRDMAKLFGYVPALVFNPQMGRMELSFHAPADGSLVMDIAHSSSRRLCKTEAIVRANPVATSTEGANVLEFLAMTVAYESLRPKFAETNVIRNGKLRRQARQGLREDQRAIAQSLLKEAKITAEDTVADVVARIGFRPLDVARGWLAMDLTKEQMDKYYMDLHELDDMLLGIMKKDYKEKREKYRKSREGVALYDVHALLADINPRWGRYFPEGHAGRAGLTPFDGELPESGQLAQNKVMEIGERLAEQATNGKVDFIASRTAQQRNRFFELMAGRTGAPGEPEGNPEDWGMLDIIKGVAVNMQTGETYDFSNYDNEDGYYSYGVLDEDTRRTHVLNCTKRFCLQCKASKNENRPINKDGVPYIIKNGDWRFWKEIGSMYNDYENMPVEPILKELNVLLAAMPTLDPAETM